MATEYVLPFTGIEVEEKLKAIEKLSNGFSWNDIKGKPFWEGIEEVEVVPETSAYQYILSIQEGLPYAVYYDGERYECIATADAYGQPMLEAEPFKIIDEGGVAYREFADGGTHTISIFTISQVTVPLSEQYIPDTIARTDNILDKNGKLLNSVLPNGYPMRPNETLLENETVSGGGLSTSYSIGLGVGRAYTVIWDGVEYHNLIAYQNDYFISLPSDLPFEVDDCPEEGLCNIITSDEAEHTITIIGPGSTIIPMSEEYIPDTIARVKDISANVLENVLDDNGIILKSVLPDGYPYVESGLSDPLVEGIATGYTEFTAKSRPMPGEVYTIIWDGVKYPDIVVKGQFPSFYLSGNFPPECGLGVDRYTWHVEYYGEDSDEHTFAVAKQISIPVPMSEQLIPDTIARVSDIPNITDIPEQVTDEHINDLIDTKLTNTVKSVNGTKPDENGNVEINTESVLDNNGKLLESVLPDGYPHGGPGQIEVLLPECTVTDGCWVDAPALEDGKSYTVVLDGVEYSNLVAEYYEDIEEDEETGEEYVIASYFEIYHSKFTIFCNDGFDEWEISIRSGEEESIMTVFTGKPSTLVPMSKEYLPKVAAIEDLTEAPTAADFNNLLAALRAAGYMAE